MSQVFGTGEDLALRVESDLPILAEEAAYYAHRGGGMLCNSMVGKEYMATEWYIPEGTTAEGYETWLYLSNPGEVEVHPIVSVMTAGARSHSQPVVLAAGGKASLRLNDIAGDGQDFATCVLSDVPILVEQIVYLE